MINFAYFIKNIGLTAISLLKVILYSKFLKTKLPVVNATDELIIFGNGPSLQTSIQKNSVFIQKRKKLCVNGFALSKEYEIIRPEYYLIADFAFWIEKPEERVRKFRDEVLNSIIQKTSWPMDFLVPFEVKKSIYFKSVFSEKSNISVYYYNKTSIKGFQNISNFLFKMNLGIPRPQNVLIPGLVLSINIGFKKIYIIGADHTWHENLYVGEDNTVYLLDKHFYDNGESAKIQYVDAYGKKFFLHQQFESLAITFKIYHTIEAYSKFRDSKIYNASEKSFIDAFERSRIQ